MTEPTRRTFLGAAASAAALPATGFTGAVDGGEPDDDPSNPKGENPEKGEDSHSFSGYPATAHTEMFMDSSSVRVQHHPEDPHYPMSLGVGGPAEHAVRVETFLDPADAREIADTLHAVADRAERVREDAERGLSGSSTRIREEDQ